MQHLILYVAYEMVKNGNYVYILSPSVIISCACYNHIYYIPTSILHSHQLLASYKLSPSVFIYPTF